MTIKQYGGVFGRNPTFNDVTIEGDLIINGEVFSGLDFQGSWNASTNSPALASSTGTKGEFYIVSVAGTTSLDGITNWGIGDWALFNGSVWQRIEGGADGNFVNLDVTGTSNLASIAGTGNVVLGNTVTNPVSNYANQQGLGWNNSTKVLEISSSVAPLQVGRTSGGGDGQVLVFRQASNVAAEIRVEGNAGYFKPYGGGGIDFSATSGTGTSELFDDYEEGVHTTAATCTTSGTIGFVSSNNQLAYTKIGNTVHVSGYLYVNAISSPVGGVQISLPFTAADLADSGGSSVASLYLTNVVASNVSDFVGKIDEGNDFLLMYLGNSNAVQATSAQQIKAGSQIYISITYKTA
tara:strand:- start:1597 stop:2649 length:1053 start_codon:yes stop_codon:yes gene_type:complete